jgi:hypothetical protein|tara:strand:+ start:901 stop:1149 length:249 start_codon:yes stop_codon:yes gene_type:complete
MHRVTAIRDHSRVGRGTCTSVDECWDDKEIIEFLDENNIVTEEGAIEWALDQEGLFLEQGLNQRWGEDDDPQLVAWKEWNNG